MKKLLATLSIVAIAVCGYSQGTINMGTAAGANTRFITDCFGNRIGGPEWLVQAYAGSGVNAPIDTLRAATEAPVSPRSTPPAALGSIPASARTFAHISPAGGPATIQIRIWNIALGSTWEAAWAASGNRLGPNMGWSDLFNFNTSDPTTSPPETPASIATAWNGMIICIPEPSTVTLGLLGGLGLLGWLRRRKLPTAARQGR